VIAIIVVPRVALADQREWYGLQPMASDAAAFALGGTAVDQQSLWSGVAAVFLYALGSPSIHAAHGNVGRALASVGLRIGVPFVGAMIGSANGVTGSGGNKAFNGFKIGGLFGVVVASVLDYTVLSYATSDSHPAALTLSFGGSFR
jgi:hypothetical protein